MKLIDLTTLQELTLPDSLLWVDEFKWGASLSKSQYTLTGDMVVQTSKRNIGRPITLEYPDENQAWVPRSLVQTLVEWLNYPTRRYTLKFQYPTDVRSFTVMFRHSEGAIESTPVKGFPEHSADAWFRLKIKLMEVA